LELEYFELMCDEPICIEGVGDIKIPTLRDIRKIGYKSYEMLTSYLAVDLQKYLDVHNLKEKYDSLSDEEKLDNSLYNIINYYLLLTSFLQFLIFLNW
jgi:hypothetical protein